MWIQPQVLRIGRDGCACRGLITRRLVGDQTIA